METLHFRLENGRTRMPTQAHLIGVVSSGNLEVLIESTELNGTCEVEVNTAAVGFGAIWQAVIADFHTRWSLANVRIAINDVGATPAVVSLRLDQAVESLQGARS
jgi:malonate decarboxylase delta subunit